MARTPNYRFERQEREKTKAAKKEAKAEAKVAKTEEDRSNPPSEPEVSNDEQV